MPLKADRLANEVLAEMGKKRSSDFIPTGLGPLDDVIGGLGFGDVCVVAARPSHGKTSLLMDLIRRAAERGVTSGVFSLEMSAESLLTRMIAGYTGVDMNKLRFGELDEDEKAAVKEIKAQLRDMPTVFNDSAYVDGEDLIAKVAEWKEGGVQLIGLDYVQLMGGNGDSRQHEVGRSMRAIKQAARESGIPIITLAQMSRGIEQRGDALPRLSDLRDSGEIEQVADQVIFIHHADPPEVDLVVAKNRNGPTGIVTVGFNPARMRFYDLKQGEDE